MSDRVMIDVEAFWKRLKETYIDLFNVHTKQVEDANKRIAWAEARAKELADALRSVRRLMEWLPKELATVDAALARYDAGQKEPR